MATMWFFPMILLGVATTALAAPAPVQRLSEAQIAHVLDQAAAKREAAEALEPQPKRAIHGEVGVEVGTGGHRAIYGTALVPLGEDGEAIVSVSSETGPIRRHHRDHY